MKYTCTEMLHDIAFSQPQLDIFLVHVVHKILRLEMLEHWIDLHFFYIKTLVQFQILFIIFFLGHELKLWMVPRECQSFTCKPCFVLECIFIIYIHFAPTS